MDVYNFKTIFMTDHNFTYIFVLNSVFLFLHNSHNFPLLLLPLRKERTHNYLISSLLHRIRLLRLFFVSLVIPILRGIRAGPC